MNIIKGPWTPPKLRIVILRNAYQSWSDPEVQTTFCRMVGLKIAGYGREYPESVYSVDTSDFFGNHLLICQENPSGDLTPLMGYKSTPLSVCRRFNLPFPALPLLESSGIQSAVPRVREELARCEREGLEITYDNAWTAAESVRNNREFSRHLREVFTTLIANYHAGEMRHWMCCGAVKFKTSEYFVKIGGQPITPEFAQKSLAGGLAVMFSFHGLNEAALEEVKTHQTLWDNRIELGSERANIKKAA